MRSARIPSNQPTGQQRRTFEVESHDPRRQTEIEHSITVAAEYSELARALIQKHAQDDAAHILELLGLDD